MLGPCDKTHATGPGFKRKQTEREVVASHWLLRSSEPAMRLHEGWRPNGRALLLSSRETEAGRSMDASYVFLGRLLHEKRILKDWTQQVGIWMQFFSAARGGVK